MSSTRVLHITDPHLFADRAASLRGAVTFATLERVLAHYAATGWRADAVALTGDLTQDESEGAVANVKALLAPLSLPILVVPGNHDVRTIMKQALSDPPFRYCGSLSFGNWLIVGIDSCVDSAAHGEVEHAELARLEHTVTASKADHVLVCVHHPPLEVGSRWLDSVGMRNREEFLAAIGRLDSVRCVLFGHIHQTIEATTEGIELIGTPSTCRQFKPLSDTFASDTRPPAYRRLELHGDGHISRELIWVGDEV